MAEAEKASDKEMAKDSNDGPKTENNLEMEEESKDELELLRQLEAQLKKRIPRPKPKKTEPERPKDDPWNKKVAEKAKLRAKKLCDPNNPLFLESYDKHRLRVMTARPMIDTSAPVVPKTSNIRSAKYNQRMAQYALIERENAIMLRHIAKVFEGPSSLDTQRKTKTLITRHSPQARRMELLRITFDNLALLKRIQEVRPCIETRVLLQDWKRNEQVIENLSLYPLYWQKKPLFGWEDHAERAKAFGPTQHVFLSLRTENEKLGTIVIELNYEVVPMTCENFRCLCTGEYNNLSYKCSKIHRIVPGILWQGGDVTGLEGIGNKSIYGDTFPDENFKLKHDKRGVVSMANCGPNTNGSQFIITARSASVLDGINVVFGKVVEGMDVLDGLQKFLGSTGVPKCDIVIYDCGMMDGPPPENTNEKDGDGDKDEEAKDN